MSSIQSEQRESKIFYTLPANNIQTSKIWYNAIFNTSPVLEYVTEGGREVTKIRYVLNNSIVNLSRHAMPVGPCYITVNSIDVIINNLNNLYPELYKTKDLPKIDKAGDNRTTELHDPSNNRLILSEL
jgi:hypothetical protein